jgi:hypothetical protein
MSGDERRGPAFSGLRWLLSLGGIASVAPGFADVDFEPAISVGVARTDNLLLTTQNPESETVYQLIPGFALRQSGTRMNAAVDYRVEGYHYVDRKEDDAFQNYLATVETALDVDNFFLDLGATRDQTIRDPESLIPRTNLPISTNRIDRDDYWFGPRFQYPLGSNVTVSGSGRRTRIEYGVDETGALLVPEFDTDEVDFSVDNYRQQEGLTWAFVYSSDATDYGPDFPDWEYRLAAIQLGAWVGRGVRVFASVGKESSWDNPLDPSLRDDYHEIGVARNAGRNFNIELAAGERSFGSSKRATLQYNFRRGNTQLGYSEQPSTQGRSPDDYLTRPGAIERFVLERVDWTLTFGLRRTQISLNVYDENREERTSVDGAPLGDEAQSGGSFLFSLGIGSRSELQLGADRINQEFADRGSQDLRTKWIGINRPLGPQTDLALTLRREHADNSNDAGYEANLVSLMLTRRFSR